MELDPSEEIDLVGLASMLGDTADPLRGLTIVYEAVRSGRLRLVPQPPGPFTDFDFSQRVTRAQVKRWLAANGGALPPDSTVSEWINPT